MKKVYRILSVVLVLILALGMTVFAETEEKAVARINGATVNMGDEFELTVSFENCNQLKAFQLSNFDFGKAVSIVDAEILIGGTAVSDWNGERLVAAFQDNTTCEGDVLKLVLKVSDEAYTSETEVTFDAILKIMDGDDEIILPSEVVAGKIVVNGIEPPKTEEELISERKQDVIALKLNASSAYTFGKMSAIDSDNSKVVPYLNNNRTLVPLRFVSETLGAEVLWETGWDYCYVVKNGKKIKITFNSDIIEVNGESVKYDAPVEVVENRTMVPIRFISEELGYDVKWNQANQVVIITPLENPWVEDGLIEKNVLEGILVTFLFHGMF